MPKDPAEVLADERIDRALAERALAEKEGRPPRTLEEIDKANKKKTKKRK